MISNSSVSAIYHQIKNNRKRFPSNVNKKIGSKLQISDCRARNAIVHYNILSVLMLWNEFPSNSGTETLFSLISCSSNFEYFVVTSAMKDGAI